MRFIKEYIVISAILIIVFGIEYFTKNKLDYSIKLIRDDIYDVEKSINEKNIKNAKKKIIEIKNNWKKEYETLALFVEHNELEKISNDIVTIEANFESEEEDMLMENIAELKFMLSHIQEKNKLNLKNIF